MLRQLNNSIQYVFRCLQWHDAIGIVNLKNVPECTRTWPTIFWQKSPYRQTWGRNCTR